MKHRRLSALAGLGAILISTTVAPGGDVCLDCGDGDGAIGILDLLAVLGQWGESGTSCDLGGDGVGVTELLTLLADWGNVCYPTDCGAGHGTCCAANGTPGCVDNACCQQICPSDPYCCDEEWDGLCASMAQSLCSCTDSCGAPGTGSCCVANGTAGCEDGPCCDAVCDLDPYCCDTEWDAQCAAEARGGACSTCIAGPCGPGNGTCCAPNGTPGCEDATCCQAVCAADPFCCDFEWDGVCADLATTECSCP